MIILLAVLNLPAGFSLLSGKLRLEDVMGQVPDLGDMRESFTRNLAIASILFSVLGILLGAGLLWRKDWARKIMRVVSVMGLLGALVQMISAFVARDAGHFLGYSIAGGCYYWAFWYLAKPAVKAVFSPPPPPPEPPVDPVS
jgi:hypothetical protein